VTATVTAVEAHLLPLASRCLSLQSTAPAAREALRWRHLPLWYPVAVFGASTAGPPCCCVHAAPLHRQGCPGEVLAEHPGGWMHLIPTQPGAGWHHRPVTVTATLTVTATVTVTLNVTVTASPVQDGAIPLHVAAWGGRLAVVRMLLEGWAGSVNCAKKVCGSLPPPSESAHSCMNLRALQL
jgi:hypothetical protein